MLVVVFVLAWPSATVAQPEPPPPGDAESPDTDAADRVAPSGEPADEEAVPFVEPAGAESIEPDVSPPPGHAVAFDPGPGPVTEDEQESESEGAGEWTNELYGYLRVSYENVQNDPNYDFVGRNDGFLINNARVGLRGVYDPVNVSYQVSIEGAADLRGDINTPENDIDVRLRDAFLRWDPASWLGIQVGQFKAPFAAEDLRSTGSLTFASRAVGHEGVLVGRGLEEPGLSVDREVGIMLSPEEPLRIGELGIGYSAMLFSGNGENQLLDDNGRPAAAARLELSYGQMLTVGGAFLFNQRTEGALPDRLRETDLGFAGDVAFTIADFTLRGQFAQMKTSFPTVGTEAQTRRAFHAEAAYRFSSLPVPVGIAYRYAYYDPWAGASATAGGLDPESFVLQYHTAGVMVEYPDENLGLSAHLDYTLTIEKPGRELDNNRLQVLVQLVY